MVFKISDYPDGSTGKTGTHFCNQRLSPEYKQEAVTLVQQSDTPISEISRNLGINDNIVDLHPILIRSGQLLA